MLFYFLSKSKKFEREFKKLNMNNNKFKIIDPFEYYIKFSKKNMTIR